ncbi:subtilisin-like protein [Auriculariales sp. MPI-PUGE-AT-0066]|nr:subtilisin-like protein [Auriculariales sp. MPI-PUGE-AT-0066]
MRRFQVLLALVASLCVSPALSADAPVYEFRSRNPYLCSTDPEVSRRIQPTPSRELPGQFIVELAVTSKKRDVDVHDNFLSELDKRLPNGFVAGKKYRSPVFNGIAIKLQVSAVNDLPAAHAHEDLASISSIGNVVAVRPVTIIPRPKLVDQKVVSSPHDPAVLPDGLSTHKMTGVDEAHAQGFTGKGIKIAIIDGGVDWSHETLGGGFGPGFKVVGGTDFVGDDYDGVNEPVPDDDPMDSCNGHGTHVAGIIGANPNNGFNISGVAYEAELLAYRVFGCEGGVADSILVDALTAAYNDEADVINMSLGSDSGWSETTISVVASRVADAGRVVSIAAGNSGEIGAFLVSTPGTGKSVIAVGSIQKCADSYNRHYISKLLTDRLQPYMHAAVPMVFNLPIPVGEKPFPLYAFTTDPNEQNTACEPLADDVPDLSQYAIVLRANLTGSCDYNTQVTNLMAKNAQLVIYYDSSLTVIPASQTLALAVSQDDHTERSLQLVETLAKNPGMTVTFPQITDSHSGTTDVPNDDDGGLTSYFSSWGPTWQGEFKPAVSAPGGNITSTYPVAMGSWAVLSGTSMATPFLSGSAALVLQARGKAAAKNMRAILESTAIGVPTTKVANALPQSLAQQGAGLVNVPAAIRVATQLSPTEILLNDTAHWKGLHKISIKNNAKKAQTYIVSHTAAGTTQTKPKGSSNFVFNEVPIVDAPATVRLSSTRLTVQPGRSASLTVNIAPPKAADPETLPIVSGWITFAGSLGDYVQAPYMGIAGNLFTAQAISTNWPELLLSVPLPALIDVDTQQVQVGPRNYSLSQPAKIPIFAYTMSTGSRRIVLDLIDAGTAVKTTIPLSSFDPVKISKMKRLWSWWWPGLAGDKHDTFSQVPVAGHIAEWAYESRSVPFITPYTGLNFPTSFANGTKVPAGQYRLLLRALRVGGEPQKEKDYDIYVSEQVGLQA